MPTVCLHKSSLNGINNTTTTTTTTKNPDEKPPNPLPPLLQTPSGLAILELQGHFNLPASITDPPPDDDGDNTSKPSPEFPIGRLVFPDYSPTNDPTDTKWMKRVYLYIGHYQLMVGEVKKLGTPLGVIQKRRRGNGDTREEGGEEEEELEVLEVVRYKALFSSRPEPVGSEESRYG